MPIYRPDYTTEQVSARATERIIQQALGVTFTEEDANKIIDVIRTATQPKQTEEKENAGEDA